MNYRKSIYVPLLVVLAMACTDKKSGTVPVSATTAEAWVTTGSQSQLLKKQTTSITFSDQSDIANNIDVDSTQSFQTVDGFGYTLTGGSAYLINRMDATSKSNLLKELFGDGADAIGISYLRVSIGASDLSAEVFSYNDLPAGQTDPALARFSLSEDTVDLLPVLKEILQINPSIKIMGSPWSPPVWMKDNVNSKGGSLLPQYYATYAQYFVKYIRAMEANGIRIDAITPQNEPQHGGNNPSMVMSAQQQADFVKNHLGPAFQAAGISTKIVVWDHNCDNPNYPITIMNDAAAKAFIDGSAFHLYAGDISALSGVKAAHPDKNLYFTEQWTGANGGFDGDLKWHVKNVIIGSMRNWSRIALEWNLANDPSYGPHTPGGCTECKGALTLNASVVTRNVSYYIVGHASKFVYPGSKRIESNGGTNLHHAAFLRPDGKKVLIVLNETGTASDFNIKYKSKLAKTSIPAGSVATYVW
jgi:glucosylceramidase